MVKQSYDGILGRPFAVVLFPMVFYNKKNIWSQLTLSGVVCGLKRKRYFDVLRDKLGMDVDSKQHGTVMSFQLKNVKILIYQTIDLLF